MHVVVAEHAVDAVTARPAEDVGGAGAAVHQVATKDQPVPPLLPADARHEFLQGAKAALHVPDDVGGHQLAAAGRIASGGTSGAAA